MLAVQWADVSYYQPVVNDSYEHPVLCVRSNDGTYRDPKFPDNFAWAKRAIAAGKLSFLIVYCVWRPNWEQTADTMIDMIGTPPHPRVVCMIDVESWGGQITGNQSDGINRLYWRLADWLGDKRRVIGYGNQGDLRSLWPTRPDGIQLVVAAYGGPPPKFPGMIAHQYSDNEPCGPFGTCDMNSANDFDDAEDLARVFGLGSLVSTHFRERNMLRFEPSHDQDAKPDATWPATEYTVTLVGPAGGWSGRQVVHFTPGYHGAWIQEAWFGPSGKHVVTPDKGVYVEQFAPNVWEAPAGDRFFVIRYAAPRHSSLTVETEH